MTKLKSLYKLASQKSTSPQNNIVYEVGPGDFEVCRIRVDCGLKGSFTISYSDIEETYSNAKDVWNLQKRSSWTFTSLHEYYEGFPVITPEIGIEFLKSFAVSS